MNYYWLYYVAPMLLAYAERNPLFALAAIAFVVARPWLPDPVVLLRNLARIGALKRQATLNAANVTARRDLGVAYLELRRPRAALRWLDEARAKEPRNQEVAYLRGVALLQIDRADEALQAFGEAVGVDADSADARRADRAFRRYGEAFLGAADACERLDRLPEAEEALSVAATYNTSSLEPIVRLARVRRRRGDSDGARTAVAEARRTFSQIPGFLKRKQVGWWVRSYFV
jgi:tetratricopeptide (TPR) repeat protein